MSIKKRIDDMNTKANALASKNFQASEELSEKALQLSKKEKLYSCS